MSVVNTINGTYTLDETSGIQNGADGTPSGTPRPDSDVNLDGGGLDAAFLTYLNGLGLTDAQKEYAALVDGASSGDNFITVSATNGEVVNDLFLSDANGDPLNGDLIADMETLANEPLYLHSDATNSDFVLVTTSATAGAGRIVGVIYLDEADNFLSGQVQMVTLEAIQHPDDQDPDDNLDLTDVLQVSSTGSLTFDFDQLKSGSSLWCAVGNQDGGLLVTGGNPLTDGANKKTNVSDVIHTSQGGDGATIGVNNQLFDNQSPNETSVFTLVTGLTTLVGADAGATGDYTVDPKPSDNKLEGIDYGGYINTSGAGIFLSQSQGNDLKDLDINLFETGGNPGSQTVEDGANYIPGLNNDTEVDVATVTILDDNLVPIGTWSISPSGSQLASGASVGDVTVTIDGNNIDVNGVQGGYTVNWTAVSGETFNRFEVVREGGQFDIGRVLVDEGARDSEGLGADLLVDDDGPAIGDIASSTVKLAAGETSGAKALGDLPGTDGEANLEITDYTSSVTLNGRVIEGHINATNTEVKYFQDLNNNDILDGNDVHWYTLSISQNGDGADFYTFNVINAPSAPPLEFNFAGLPSGQNLFGMVAQQGAPNGPGIVFFSNTADIKDPGNGEMDKGSGTINTSQGGGPTTIGSNNQMIDPGEGIFFTIVNDPDDRYLANVTDGLDQNEADDADFMDYASLREVPGAFMRVSQTQGNEVEACTVEAFNITSNSTEGRALLTAAKTHIDITKVLVYNGSIDPANLLAETINGVDDDANDSIGVSISGGIATITGLEAGYLVVWETSGMHDQVLVTGTAGKFDIGGFGISEPQVTPDHPLNFEVTITDGDGDAAVDNFTVNVDAVPFV